MLDDTQQAAFQRYIRAGQSAIQYAIGPQSAPRTKPHIDSCTRRWRHDA
ncbi:MAG TPA: hypothetical protein VGP56_10930 [Gaiellaceae bacterium]|nr:hypothetical protein [Gaiellaceae bacterium]